MSKAQTMSEIARLIKEYDKELRLALQTSRSGLFKSSDGEYYVRTEVPLGQKYKDEVVSIFADESDLDFFYKLYLDE